MKFFLKARSIRNRLLTASAVATMTLPLVASASVSDIGISYDEADLDSARGQQKLYFRMQNAAQKLCGSTDIRIAGSLRRAAANEACYRDTLTAAIERLDNAEVMALHSRKSSAL